MEKTKITCEEAATICTKSQYGAATIKEKIKLNYHFVFCKICRRFSKQNSKLSEICALAKEHQSKHTLSNVEKQQWKEEIKRLENNS